MSVKPLLVSVVSADPPTVEQFHNIRAIVKTLEPSSTWVLPLGSECLSVEKNADFDSRLYLTALAIASEFKTENIRSLRHEQSEHPTVENVLNIIREAVADGVDSVFIYFGVSVSQGELVLGILRALRSRLDEVNEMCPIYVHRISAHAPVQLSDFLSTSENGEPPLDFVKPVTAFDQLPTLVQSAVLRYNLYRFISPFGEGWRQKSASTRSIWEQLGGWYSGCSLLSSCESVVSTINNTVLLEAPRKVVEEESDLGSLEAQENPFRRSSSTQKRNNGGNGSKKMHRVGIFGGSFAPITFAHLSMVFQLSRADIFDEIWIVPCGYRPDKPSLTLCPYERYIHCLLALESLDTLSVSDIDKLDCIVRVMPLELGFEKALPSIELFDRLDFVKRFYNFFDVTFALIVGADLVPTLINWDEGQRLLDQVQFVFLPRTNHDILWHSRTPTLSFDFEYIRSQEQELEELEEDRKRSGAGNPFSDTSTPRLPAVNNRPPVKLPKKWVYVTKCRSKDRKSNEYEEITSAPLSSTFVRKEIRENIGSEKLAEIISNYVPPSVVQRIQETQMWNTLTT